jgi:hypothetical protein
MSFPDGIIVAVMAPFAAAHQMVDGTALRRYLEADVSARSGAVR